MYAYSRAEALDPVNPAPAYFIGIALIQSQRFGEARQVWAEMIARAPEGAEWLPAMQERRGLLDAMLAQGMSAQ